MYICKMEYLQEHWLEWFGVITGLLYLYLEIKQYPIMWIVGFVTSFVYIIVYLQAKFYAYGFLNIYYVIISVYGFWLWVRKTNPNKQQDAFAPFFQHISRRLSLVLFLLATVLSGAIYYVLLKFTDSVMPLAEAVATSLSIVATWMVAKRFLEHWFVWVIVNIISVGMFVIQGMYPTVLLFFCYVFLSSIGYFEWKKFNNQEVQ